RLGMTSLLPMASQLVKPPVSKPPLRSWARAGWLANVHSRARASPYCRRLPRVMTNGTGVLWEKRQGMECPLAVSTLEYRLVLVHVWCRGLSGKSSPEPLDPLACLPRLGNLTLALAQQAFTAIFCRPVLHIRCLGVCKTDRALESRARSKRHRVSPAAYYVRGSSPWRRTTWAVACCIRST